MKATSCLQRCACRYQQAITLIERKAGIKPDECWADLIQCDDLKTNMDKRCDRFFPREETPKKLLAILLVLLCGVLTSCARDRSGKYVSQVVTKEKCYLATDGRLVPANSPEGWNYSPFFASADGRRAAKVVYRDAVTKLILTLRQDKADIGGNLVATDDRQLTEYVVKVGYLDPTGLMHLKLTAKPDAQASVTAFGVGLSGAMAESLICLDQIKDRGNRLTFKIKDSVNILAGTLDLNGPESDEIIFTNTKPRKA